MEDHHDKARPRNVFQNVLSTLMDWDWKLGLFLTMPTRRAPTWPEVQNGASPVQLLMTMGSISQARLAEVSPVLGALIFPVYGQDKIFDVFELVEFLVTAHTHHEARNFITQLSWRLGSLIEKRLMGMMEAEVSDGVEHSYSIVVADHNELGLSDENDTRILCGYLDARLRASGDAIEKAIAVDKVRVMGKDQLLLQELDRVQILNFERFQLHLFLCMSPFLNILLLI